MNTYRVTLNNDKSYIVSGVDVMELDHKNGYLLFWKNKDLFERSELFSFYKLGDVLSANKVLSVENEKILNEVDKYINS